jgi:hypothetical protein
MIYDFFKGTQKQQFDESRRTLIIFDSNKDYADKSEELVEVVKRMFNILTKEEPYSDIHELPLLRKDLIDILGKMYEEKSAPIIKKVNDTITYIKEETERYNGDKNIADIFINDCKSTLNCLEHSNELKDIYAQETRIDQLKDSFVQNLDCQRETAKIKSDEKNDEKFITRKIVRTETLMNRSYEINSKDDIEKYINDLRSKLIKE